MKTSRSIPLTLLFLVCLALPFLFMPGEARSECPTPPNVTFLSLNNNPHGLINAAEEEDPIPVNIKNLNNRSKANVLLNWAEHLYPGLFPPRPITEYMAHLGVFYRHYPTRLLLGTFQDHLYLADEESQLIDLGAVDDWLPLAQGPDASQVSFGYVYSDVYLDRTPGMGNCGVGPWADDPGCISIKIWWKLQLKAFAQTPVLIIPDGQERWVITNMGSVAQKYGVSMPDSSTLGTYQSMLLDPKVTNPECAISSFEGPDFSFQIMGTREMGLTELILSSNATEYTEGACLQAAFAYDTTCLLNAWAAGLSGDPTDLRLQLNDTFREAPGQYTFIKTFNTNPSPENRDRVRVELGFLCTSSPTGGDTVPCPWE